MKVIEMNKLKEEADRCFTCKVAKCRKNCPIDTPIPEVIQLFKENKIEEAGEILFNNNPLSAICGVVCPHEDQCLGNCIRGIKSEPVNFLRPSVDKMFESATPSPISPTPTLSHPSNRVSTSIDSAKWTSSLPMPMHPISSHHRT